MPSVAARSAQRGAAPRPVGFVPLLWRAGALTGPAGLAGGLGLAYASLTPLGAGAALAAGVATVGGTMVARGTVRERVERAREGVAGWQEARGTMPTRVDVAPEHAQHHEVGAFRISATGWPDGKPVVYLPQRGHHPHILVLGSTGGGKTESLALLIWQAMGWGWDVVVIDAKGGSDYDWLEDSGYEHAKVVQTPDLIQAELRVAVEVMQERYSALREVRVPAPDTRGVRRMRRPKNMHEWMTLAPPHQRPDFRSVLLVIDELDDVTKHPKLGEQNTRYLEQLSARSRGASLHLAIGTQAAYAEHLPGFVKANAKARLVFGDQDQVQADMSIGQEARQYLAAAGAPTERPAGRAVFIDGAGGPPRITQSRLLDVAQLAPTEEDWEAELLRRADEEAAEVQGADQVADHGTGEVALAEVVELPAGPDQGRAGADSGGAVLGQDRGPSGASPVGHPPGGGVLPGSPPRSHSRPSHSPPLAAPVDPDRPAASRLIGLAARTVLFVPWRRLLLRATVWRLVLGPRVRGRGIVRRKSARLGERERTGGVCDICRRPPTAAPGGGWQVEHRRPKWAGGTDDPSNLWTLCSACHRIKTRAENRARRWRDRSFGLAALERAPGYAWSALAAVVLAGLHVARQAPYGWWSLLGAALLVWGFWRTRPKTGGMDGVDELEKGEAQDRDTVGDAAAVWIWWRRHWHGFRLALGLAAHLYLLIRLVVLALIAWHLWSGGGPVDALPLPGSEAAETYR